MRRIAVLAVGALTTLSATAQYLTEGNVSKANEIIEAAVAAHGGERLTSLKTLVIEQQSKGTAVNQSLRPAPPWDRNSNSGFSAIDLENSIFASSNAGTGGGFEFDNGTIINGDDSYQLNYRAGTATPVAEPNFDNTSGPFIRVTPPLLVRQLQEHARTAHFLGETEHEGRPHLVVAFSMPVGPSISLYFDAETSLLSYSERVFPGFGLVQYRFLDYQTVDGVAFNQGFELLLNGDLNIERRNNNPKLNQPIDQYLTVDSSLSKVDPLTPDEMSRQQIADGVFLIGGNGTYGLFIEHNDYVVAIGGTGGIEARIEQLRDAVPEKPIRYGVMTHHHSDHVLAVPTYVTEGATVIGATAHAEVIRDAAGEDSADLKLETVAERRVIGSGKNRVELIDIGPTAHTEHLLIAWLPEHKILFEADHFAMPRTGPVPPAVSSTRTFAEALKRNDLQPAILTSSHSPRIGTMADLQTALSKRPARPTSESLSAR